MGLNYHTHYLSSSGIKGCGCNTYGQLGTGSASTKEINVIPININDIQQIAYGNYFTMFLMSDGTVKAVGRNVNGQLGLGNFTDQITVQDTGLTGVKQIACGSEYSLFLMDDGSVKGCGRNQNGQLGLGYANSNVSTITTLQISGVKKINCGESHSLFLMEDGSVKGCGNNSSGQLGLGHINFPVLTISPIIISGVKDIICGGAHTAFLMHDGTVKIVGNNIKGQLGLDHMANVSTITDVAIANVKKISTGYFHTVFLMEDGTIKTVGDNQYGQLGIDNYTTQSSLQNCSISDVQQIASGSYHTIFLMNDGSVKAVGRNDLGQLGIGTSNNTSTIADVPIDNVISLVENYTFLDEQTFLYLIDDIGEIKYYDAGWSSLGNISLTKSEFEDYGMVDLQEIVQNIESLNNPKLLVFGITTELPKIKIKNIPKPKLIFPEGDIRLNSVENIDDISLVGTQSGNGIVRIICSADQEATWKTWDAVGNNWASIDESDMDQVKENGMSIDVFNNRSSAEWNTMVNSSSTLRFTYYLEVDDISDEANTDTLEAQFDMKGSWEMTKPGEDYSYKYVANDKLSVSIYKNGDFKINY